MAKNQTRRISPAALAEDETTFNALQNVTGYAPNNPSCTIASLTQILNNMRAAQTAADQAIAAAATARDQAAVAEWEFHNHILSAKDQVKAQYGKDSTQVQELGLKRASEYKNRKRKNAADPK